MSAYLRKAKEFKKLIRKNYPNYSVKLEANLDHYIFSICDGEFSIYTMLEKDISWEDFDKKLKKKMTHGEEQECEICMKKFIAMGVACHFCCNTLCEECFVKIERNNGIFKCPFCRKYTGDIGERLPNIIKMLMDDLDVQYNYNNREEVLAPVFEMLADFL